MVDLQDNRERRMAELVEQHGCVPWCCAPAQRPLPQWALLEAAAEGLDDPRPSWRVGENWTELLTLSADQEYPEDRPATQLFDLDSDWSTTIEQTVVYKPFVAPGG